MKLVNFFAIYFVFTTYTCEILSPKERDLYLLYRTEKEGMHDLQHALGYQAYAMQNISEHFRASRIESQIDEILQSSLDKY